MNATAATVPTFIDHEAALIRRVLKRIEDADERREHDRRNVDPRWEGRKR